MNFKLLVRNASQLVQITKDTNVAVLKGFVTFFVLRTVGNRFRAGAEQNEPEILCAEGERYSVLVDEGGKIAAVGSDEAVQKHLKSDGEKVIRSETDFNVKEPKLVIYKTLTRLGREDNRCEGRSCHAGPCRWPYACCIRWRESTRVCDEAKRRNVHGSE